VITFRRTLPEDLLLITEWISQDAAHKHIRASFFTAEGPFLSCYTIEDEQGPVIFVRQETAGQDTRLHTQFPQDAKRVAKALEEAYPLVASDAKERGFRSVRFETGSIALVRFMFQHFEFRADLIDELGREKNVRI